MSNRVTNFEIPCDDPEKTMQFFKDVFNWSFQRFGENDYWFAHTGDENEPGINGAIMKKRDPSQPITNSISVSDMDAILEQIGPAGGKVVVPKTAVPNVGWMAFFKDPDGNIHGVWQADQKAA